MTIAWPRYGGDTQSWAGRLLFALEQQQTEQQALANRVSQLEVAAGDIGLEFPIRVDLGGTGASSPAAAQVNLELRPGADVQAFSPVLLSLAGQAGASDTFPYYSNVNTFSTTPLTAKGREILSQNDAAGVISALGLGTMALQNANAVAITGGSGLFRTLQLQDEVDGAASVGFFNTYPHMTGRMELDLVANGVTGRLVANGVGAFYIQSSHTIYFTSNNIAVMQMNIDGSSLFSGIVRGITAAPGTADTRFATTAFVAAGFQPLDAELSALAGLVSAANQFPYFTGAGTATLAPSTAFGRGMLNLADAAAGRTAFALGTIATQNANAVAITGGAIDNTPIGQTTPALISASGYSIGANFVVVSTGGYHALRDIGGTNAILLGNGDTTNYYQNTTHSFLQRSGGGTAFANLNASRLDLAANEIRVGGDIGGAASRNTLTGAANTSANSTGVGTVKLKGATNRDSVGFIKMYVGTTAIWLPYWTTITG